MAQTEVPENITLLKRPGEGVCVYASMPASLIRMSRLDKFIDDTKHQVENGEDLVNDLELVFDAELGECVVYLHNVIVLATRDTIKRMFYVQGLIFDSTGEKIPVDLPIVGKMQDDILH